MTAFVKGARNPMYPLRSIQVLSLFLGGYFFGAELVRPGIGWTAVFCLACAFEPFISRRVRNAR